MPDKHHPSAEQGNRTSSQTRRIVLTGLLFAVAMILTFIENMIPFPMPVPGIRLGLSNIVTMYALFFMKKRTAFELVFMKALFVFLTRGAIASLLSLSGGLASILVMLLVMLLTRRQASVLLLSVVGAVVHNAGQLGAVSLIYTNVWVWGYLPVLFIAGILAGVATSVLLKVTLPALKRLDLR